MSRFWRIWLTVWCWALALYGVVLAGGRWDARRYPDRLLFEFLNGTQQLDLDPGVRHLAALGAVTIIWSFTVYAAVLVAARYAKAGESVWGIVTASALTLYVIASGLSVVTGFARNVVPNTVFLAALTLPVVLNRSRESP
jgi:hypothetical protein